MIHFIYHFIVYYLSNKNKLSLRYPDSNKQEKVNFLPRFLSLLRGLVAKCTLTDKNSVHVIGEKLSNA